MTGNMTKAASDTGQMIGHGTWIDKLAYDLVCREQSLGRSTKILTVESGLGASGIPHIGSLGDAARAYGVKLALENLGYDSKLIAYSDDLDGLRKVPAGLPDSLQEHLAKPVSLIPDPYGCHDSYGMHMSGILLDGLDRVGIKYEFRRAAETYRQGLLKEQIHTILARSDEIGAKIAEFVGQEKYQSRLPYFPVCASCDRLYTAKATEYLESEGKVAYECEDAQMGGLTVAGCGHRGTADIAGSLGKLAWKVEFAARWAAFDVRFEAYGKDIMDSVMVNDWVSDEILGFAHPHHVKYEMFLDKGGKKISKSAGNVLTAQRWLQFGSPQSILLLLYKRITGARELGLEDVPLLMDEFNELEDIYFDKAKKTDNEARLARSKGLYMYANLLDPPEGPSVHVSYMLLVELAKIFTKDRTRQIVRRLLEYGTIKATSPDVELLVELAGRYADEFGRREAVRIELDAGSRQALHDVAVMLRSIGGGEAEEGGGADRIQRGIYDIARSNGISTKILFVLMYKIILGTTGGPRMGPFVADIGEENVAQMILEHI